ncbi:hypothetical protein OWT26_03910 [Burkholderia sp. 1A5]
MPYHVVRLALDLLGRKPLTWMNAAFAYVMWLSTSVVDISVASSANSNSRCVTGWLLRMVWSSG